MKKILINREAWQTRVAVLSNDKLQDIYYDTGSKEDLERCYFKGKISKILPGIQTAFVDIGQTKAGFLHITEIDRALATEKVIEEMQDGDDSKEEINLKELKSSIDISKIFTEGSDVLVQVIKEPISEKGAKLTTCFTIPGKFVVLMPNIPQIGVSKKIESRDERTRLKDILTLYLPKGMGAIVRTTAENRSPSDIQKDIAFLVSTWKSILKKYAKASPCEKIYSDLPLSLRAMRDHLDEDVEMVILDNKAEQESVFKFVKNLTPEFINKIRYYQGPPSLFDRFDIDQQIEKALQQKVSLKSGGSLVIETTEAMTVIDVNTGKFTGSGSLEETILKTNLEAAEEIVTQLRLRNIGGLIVIDFIDMSSGNNRQKLSRFLEKTLKERDKFQSVALKVSEFGIVQMTRKRSGKTLAQQLTNLCAHCHGNGVVKSTATNAFTILKKSKEEIIRLNLQEAVVMTTSHKVFDYLIQQEYRSILQLEKDLNIKIILESNEFYEEGQSSVARSQ